MEKLTQKFDKRFPTSDEVACAAMLDPSMVNLDAVNSYVGNSNDAKLSFIKKMMAKHVTIVEEEIPMNSPVILLSIF